MFIYRLLNWSRLVVFDGDFQVLQDMKDAFINKQLKMKRTKLNQDADSDEEENNYHPKTCLGFISRENEIKVWTMINKKAKSTIEGYPTSIEEDEALLAQDDAENKLTSNQKNCLIFRLGEKRVFLNHIDFTNQMLALFDMPLKEARKSVDKNNEKWKYMLEYIKDNVFPTLQ